MKDDFRKIVREVLLENSFVPVTKKFDHLKWTLNDEQKIFLDYFITSDPDSLSDNDYIHASSVTKIPTKNLKSILLTYGTYNEKEKLKKLLPNDFVKNGCIPPESRFLFGNKPFNAKEMDLELSYRNDVVNFKSVSKDYSDSKRYKSYVDATKKSSLLNKDYKSKEVPDNMIKSDNNYFKIKKSNKEKYKEILNSIKSDLDKLFF